MIYETQKKWILGCIKNYNEQVPPEHQIKNPFDNILKMNNDNSFDFDFATANIKIQDTNLFSKKELPSIKLLNEILQDRIEMKNHDKTMRTKNLYIEYEQDTNGNSIFRPSGIAVSKSGRYFFNIGGIGLFLKTDFLKWLYENKEELNLKLADNSKTGSDNITNAFLVPFKDILILQNKYKEYLIDLSFKNIRKKLFNKK